ncbi:hypothetical protein PF006_g8607 [Phytophthora fragariae]|uniref:DDE Tnp4 domain-containing protein n=1 Tax=Phytophthora fragariae TaxID=53985 RepID=A0A6A3U9V2_9STRA|nr:hypothetical protein PF006_g8607 [Phytophthora fragariae]
MTYSLDRAAKLQAQLAFVLSELLLTPSSPPQLILKPVKEAVALLAGSLGCAVDSVALRTRSFVPRSLQWRAFVFSSFAAPSEFRSHFRLTRAAFSELLAVLAPLIIKQESRFGKPLPAAVRPAVFLFFCGHGCSLHVLSAQFGIGKSTASSIIHEVARAIVARMKSLVAFPTTRAQLLKLSIEFEDGYGIPGCVGALDGCHIPIVQPSVSNSKKLYNRCFYSFNMSAVVDKRRRFLDIDVRWPVSVGDSRVFSNSAVVRVHASILGKLGGPDGAGRLLTGLNEHYSIPFFLLADSAYANSKHVVTTFEIAETQRYVPTAHLNRALAGMRYPVECEFGILKSRRRVLGKPVEMARTNVEVVPTLIADVCILHNFAIGLGGGVWNVDAEADQRAFYFAKLSDDDERWATLWRLPY